MWLFARDRKVLRHFPFRDIQSQLAGRVLGDLVLVPQVALSEKAGVFLDDLTLDDVSARVGVAVRAVEPSAGALVTALLGR